MHSCLYEGHVRHRRNSTVTRAFCYRLCLVYVDLDELDSLFGRRGLWSVRRPAVARFCRDDHLGPAGIPLAEAVRGLVQERLGRSPQGPIRLLTHFRYFGIAMNPISLYYCFEPDGETLDAVVAEVNNTPWGEQHCYVIDARGRASRKYLAAMTAKRMHVSPFLPMALDYAWHLRVPGETLAVGIRCRANHDTLFSASLALRRRPLTRASLAGALVRYPLMTARVLQGIYWQALVTWLRGVPVITHPRHALPSAVRQPAQPFPHR